MKINKTFIYFKSIVVLLLFIIIFFSCKNDIKTVSSICARDNSPVEITKDVEFTYSDSGRVEILLTAPVSNRYVSDNPYIELPKGMKVVFYDSLKKNITSSITANYAINYEKKHIVEAKNNVIVINYQKKERLNTEHLIWDQNKGTIYSDKFVKITTKEEVLFGEGFTSNENFVSWSINKPTGSFIIKHED
jgi:LPS export ABC transporter protein LptC